jgi:cytochrome c553
MKKFLVLVLFAALGVCASYAKDAKENYTTYCKNCHGAEGKGDTKFGQKFGCKDYSDPKIQAAIKDEQIFKAMKEGVKKADRTVMQPYNEKLTDDEIKAIVVYFRTLAPKK